MFGVRGNQREFLKSRFFHASVILLIVFGAMSYWSGLPTAIPLYQFLIGTIFFLVIFLGFVFLTWQLLLRPLPPNLKTSQPNPLNRGQQYLITVILGIGILFLQIGGIWDEAWHREYNLDFGDDLFWRPHQLIYGAFLIYIILGFYGFYIVSKKTRGSLQQRFRANPYVGLLTLVGGFLLYSLPADPIWHILYGADLTAWSLPHLVLLFNMLVTAYLAIGLRLQIEPKTKWGIFNLSYSNTFSIFIAGISLVASLQILTTEWDALFTGATSPELLSYWNRPDWMLPVVVVVTAVFFSILLIHTVKMGGAATLGLLVTLGIRSFVIQILQFELLRVYPIYLLLGPTLAIDAWYIYQIYRYKQPRFPFWADAIVGMVGTAVFTFPLINSLYTYPTINGRLLPAIIIIGLLAAAGTAYLGRQLGTSLQSTQEQLPALHKEKRIRAVSPLLMIGLTGFILFFILTAPPPI